MSKWNFLHEFTKQHEGKSKAEIARLAIKEFELALDPEQVRKIISKQTCKCSDFEQLEELIPLDKEETKQDTPAQFSTPGMYLVLGCVHVPGENKSMINGISQLVKDLDTNLQGLALIGDFLDMNSLSGHDVGKFTAIPGLTLGKEYEAGNKVLDQITEGLNPKATKIFMYGNHEDRYNRYMGDMQKAKATIASPQEALKLDQRGFYTYTKWQQDKVTLGSHLDLIHGEYFNVHSAKKHIDVYRGSVMYVHTHRIQTYIEGEVGGFNIGWGGEASSPLFNYMPRGTKSQWQNGFAMVTIDNQGNYYVQQIIHHNNKFFFNNKFYGN